MNKKIRLSTGISSYYDSLNNKLPLLILHGFSLKIGYKPYLKLLEKKFRVVIPDLPFASGYGFNKAHTLANYTDFLLELVERLDLKKVNLYGNSLGGALALSCLLKYPDRFDKAVVRSPFYTRKQLPLKFRNPALLALYKGLAYSPFTLGLAAKRFYNKMAKESLNINTDRYLYQKIREKQDRLDHKKGRDLIFDLLYSNLEKDLPKIKNKVYIIWPEKDTLLSLKSAEPLLNSINSSKLLIEKNTYHCIATADPNKLSEEIISFICS